MPEIFSLVKLLVIFNDATLTPPQLKAFHQDAFLEFAEGKGAFFTLKNHLFLILKNGENLHSEFRDTTFVFGMFK